MSHPPLRDDPRDAHLLAALRHAPDRDVVPPAALTAAILDRAQQALQPPRARRPKWRDALRGFFDKLWQPAPMAAFGTLAMATLIGVMWGAQDLPEATPSLRPELAAVPPGQSSKAADAVPQALRPPAGEREAVASSTPERPPPPTPTAKQAAMPTRPPAAPARLRQDAPQQAAAQRDGALALETPPPPPVNDAAGAAPTPTPATAAMPTLTEQRSASAGSSGNTAPAALPAPSRARSEFAGSALSAVAPALASPVARAAAEIDAAMAGNAARVHWRITAQRLVAHDSTQRDWLSALARGTAGRWQPAASAAASGAESEPITLLIDGAPRGSLSFEPQALVWRDAGGAAWRAPVPASTLRSWQEAITHW